MIPFAVSMASKQDAVTAWRRDAGHRILWSSLLHIIHVEAGPADQKARDPFPKKLNSVYKGHHWSDVTWEVSNNKLLGPLSSILLSVANERGNMRTPRIENGGKTGGGIGNEPGK